MVESTARTTYKSQYGTDVDEQQARQRALAKVTFDREKYDRLNHVAFQLLPLKMRRLNI